MIKKIVIMLSLPTILFGMEGGENPTRLEMHDESPEPVKFRMSHLKEKICESCKNRRSCKPQCCVEFDEQNDFPGGWGSCCCIITCVTVAGVGCGAVLFGCIYALTR